MFFNAMRPAVTTEPLSLKNSGGVEAREKRNLIVGRLHAAAFRCKPNNAGNGSAGGVQTLIQFVAQIEQGLFDRESKLRRMRPPCEYLQCRRKISANEDHALAADHSLSAALALLLALTQLITPALGNR